MTPEQQNDIDRLERYIVREGLSSVMNDTKWREVKAIIDEVLGSGVRFRIKDVRMAETVATIPWQIDFKYHIPHFCRSIEWMEFDPIVKWHRGESELDRT